MNKPQQSKPGTVKPHPRAPIVNIAAPSTSDQCGAQAPDPSEELPALRHALDSLEGSINDLTHSVTHLAHRLYPVLTPVPQCPSGPDMQSCGKESEIISSYVYRKVSEIQALIAHLNDLHNRLEV